MRSKIRFKPALVPTVAAVAGIVITAMLGDWQLNRAARKAQLEAQVREAAHAPAIRIGPELVEAQSLLYHNVEVRGRFDAQRTIYIDNRVHQGVPGYQVVTPLKIAGSSRYVLIERGWIAAQRDRSHVPEVLVPADEVQIEGIAMPGNPPVFELSQQVIAGNLWQNVTVERFHTRFGLDLQPILIQQHSALEDGLIREWSSPSLGIERHRAYALQWFSLALAILILYLVLNVRRTKTSA